MGKEELVSNNPINNNIWNIDLDYVKEDNITSVFSSNGNIHPYPAKAVPEMVHDLLLKLKESYKVQSVLDPFVGSGTVALESKILGLDFCGCDLNPLAVLLARTKSLVVEDTMYIRKTLENFITKITENSIDNSVYLIENFKNINYWFKNENIKQLSYIKHSINIFLKDTSINYRETLALIILTAFSGSIRESSLTRNDEFKLYRLSPSDIKKFNVNSVSIFKRRVENLLNMIQEVNTTFLGKTEAQITLNNAKDLKFLGNKKFDLILTSPPYGDSKSTVAYGQFSRLSLQWMADIMKKYLNISTENTNCDEYLLGGKFSITNDLQAIQEEILKNSETLRTLMRDIDEITASELKELYVIKRKLLELQERLDSEDKDFNIDVTGTDLMSILIKEKIRLYIYRKINSKLNLSKKQKRKYVKCATEMFVTDLIKYNYRSQRKYKILKELFPSIIQAVERKIKSLPKRKKEVIGFFTDLYEVVKQANNVTNDSGIQVWIVGHRTVMGKLEVKMSDIILQWFEKLNYSKLALLKRNYHFKRLPHHINSTITRSKQISTMMEEHVLIVRKTGY